MAGMWDTRPKYSGYRGEKKKKPAISFPTTPIIFVPHHRLFLYKRKLRRVEKRMRNICCSFTWPYSLRILIVVFSDAWQREGFLWNSG